MLTGSRQAIKRRKGAGQGMKPSPTAPARGSALYGLTALAGDPGGQGAQAEDADQVREDLQRVHQVPPGPYQVDLGDRAEGDQQAVDPAVRHDHARPQPVLEELLAVIGPADQRAVAEEEDAER